MGTVLLSCILERRGCERREPFRDGRDPGAAILSRENAVDAWRDFRIGERLT
jgi:hypothetical protein